MAARRNREYKINEGVAHTISESYIYIYIYIYGVDVGVDPGNLWGNGIYIYIYIYIRRRPGRRSIFAFFRASPGFLSPRFSFVFLNDRKEINKKNETHVAMVLNYCRRRPGVDPSVQLSARLPVSFPSLPPLIPLLI